MPVTEVREFGAACVMEAPEPDPKRIMLVAVPKAPWKS